MVQFQPHQKMQKSKWTDRKEKKDWKFIFHWCTHGFLYKLQSGQQWKLGRKYVLSQPPINLRLLGFVHFLMHNNYSVKYTLTSRACALDVSIAKLAFHSVLNRFDCSNSSSSSGSVCSYDCLVYLFIRSPNVNCILSVFSSSLQEKGKRLMRK